MPGNEIAWFDSWHMNHGPLQLKVWVQLIGEFLSVARRSALQLAVHVRFANELPIAFVKEARALGVVQRRKEWTEQDISRGHVHERVHE
jgi:hypothetical protein